MQGLEKFKEYMSGFRSHYVVIGGLATVLTLEDRNLPARATKDVDMIIICQPEALIVLKAVAYNENLRRKETGANVDQRDVDKHKKDVYRLAYVFDGSERFEVNETIKAQMKAFISEVEKSPIDGKNMFRGKGIPAMGMKEFTELIRGMFGVE